MIGATLIQEVVQSVAASHRIAGYGRTSLLLLAGPENGKTTITQAAKSKHVCPVAIMSGRSILREIKDHPETEFLLFNDLSSIRAMSQTATSLVVVLLNQLTQNERGRVAFAGMEPEDINRQIGIIGCCPFDIFTDHRARWKEMGFISRAIPFSYSYHPNIIAQIKDSIDSGTHRGKTAGPTRPMPAIGPKMITIQVPPTTTKLIRSLADARAKTLDQLGIRLLSNYHVLIRAHALIKGRRAVTDQDAEFLTEVDRFVSIDECRPLKMEKT